jgi:hypothetical protein
MLFVQQTKLAPIPETGIAAARLASASSNRLANRHLVKLESHVTSRKQTEATRSNRH